MATNLQRLINICKFIDTKETIEFCILPEEDKIKTFPCVNIIYDFIQDKLTSYEFPKNHETLNLFVTNILGIYNILHDQKKSKEIKKELEKLDALYSLDKILKFMDMYVDMYLKVILNKTDMQNRDFLNFCYDCIGLFKKWATTEEQQKIKANIEAKLINIKYRTLIFATSYNILRFTGGA